MQSTTQQRVSDRESSRGPVRTTYEFDRFRFSTTPLELRSEGDRVDVRPQSLRLLEVLLESIGSVVDTDTAVDRLWPRGDGNERVLRVAMAHLRRALGRGNDTPTYVETVRGQGYRFVHPVEITEEQLVQRQDPSRRSWFGV